MGLTKCSLHYCKRECLIKGCAPVNGDGWNKQPKNSSLSGFVNAFGSVWRHDGFYHLYYANFVNVYHATSSDGREWYHYANPVLRGQEGAWDEGVDLAMVFRDNNMWYMLYRGRNWKMKPSHAVGLAVSADGNLWNKYEANPVLKPTSGQWDGLYMDADMPNIFDPWGIIKVGDTYYLWYNADTPTMCRCAGLATSKDLLNWEKDTNNPIFTHGRFCVFPFKVGDFYYAIVPYGGYQRKHICFELYRDKNPTFYEKDREFLKVVLGCGNVGDFDERYIDTPNIVTNDIKRDSFPDNDVARVYYTGEAGQSGHWTIGSARFGLDTLESGKGETNDIK